MHYYDDTNWASAADGGGSSLELRDPNADNSKAEAWAASDESNRSSWQSYSYTRTVVPLVFGPPVNFQELAMGLLDEGEVLIDNITVTNVAHLRRRWRTNDVGHGAAWPRRLALATPLFRTRLMRRLTLTNGCRRLR